MNAGRGLVDRPFSLYTCFSPTTRPKYRAIKMEKKKKKKKPMHKRTCTEPTVRSIILPVAVL